MCILKRNNDGIMEEQEQEQEQKKKKKHRHLTSERLV